MNNNDKELFFSSLQAVMDVYGKPKLTAGAAQIWWDTVKEFDHNNVFTEVNYWAQYNNKAPVPADIWKSLNEKRTFNLEAKAAKERLVNTGKELPADYRPTPEGKAFFRVIRAWMRQLGKPIHHAILDAHDEGVNLPESVVTWAKGIDA